MKFAETTRGFVLPQDILRRHCVKWKPNGGGKHIGGNRREAAAAKRWDRFINGFLDLLSVQFVSRFGKKPMHFFGALGSLTFIIGLIITIYLVIERLTEGAGYGLTNKPGFYLALTAMVLGTFFFLTGFIAELVSRTAADRNHYLIDQKIGWDGGTAI